MIVKSADQVFEHIEHGFDACSGAVELKRCHRALIQIRTHENDGASAGGGKDKTHHPARRLPQQVYRRDRYDFSFTIDLTFYVFEQLFVCEKVL